MMTYLMALNPKKQNFNQENVFIWETRGIDEYANICVTASVTIMSKDLPSYCTCA